MSNPTAISALGFHDERESGAMREPELMAGRARPNAGFRSRYENAAQPMPCHRQHPCAASVRCVPQSRSAVYPGVNLPIPLVELARVGLVNPAITERMPDALSSGVIAALGPPMSVFTQPGCIRATVMGSSRQSMASAWATLQRPALVEDRCTFHPWARWMPRAGWSRSSACRRRMLPGSP